MTPLEQLKEEILIIVKNSINGTISNRELNKFINKAIVRFTEKHHIPDIGKTIITHPHTHGEHGSHTRVVNEEEFRETDTSCLHFIEYLQFICLDDGVIYKELEITREVK